MFSNNSKSQGWTVDRHIDSIPPRIRDVADSSVVTTVSDRMRHSCMTVTMELIDNLKYMMDEERVKPIIRSMMTVSYGIPIKIMCIGLFPYEQDILPPVATALSYSPLNCIGCTPSVQILSQAMALIGSKIKTKYSNRKIDGASYGDNSRSILTARFAMLLRCSYLCSNVRVSFVNCVPIYMDTMAKRVRCASFFSEWLGKMITIYDSFGFGVAITAMGAFAVDTVRNTFSSFAGRS